jgi:hypothetical protein
MKHTPEDHRTGCSVPLAQLAVVIRPLGSPDRLSDVPPPSPVTTQEMTPKG